MYVEVFRLLLQIELSERDRSTIDVRRLVALGTAPKWDEARSTRRVLIDFRVSAPLSMAAICFGPTRIKPHTSER